MHVFKALYWSFMIKTLHISIEHGTYDIVSHHFGSDYVCCLCSNFMWVFNKITSHCDLYYVWDKFLWSIINYNMCICDFFTCMYVSDWIMNKGLKYIAFHDVNFDHVSFVDDCKLFIAGDNQEFVMVVGSGWWVSMFPEMV